MYAIIPVQTWSKICSGGWLILFDNLPNDVNSHCVLIGWQFHASAICFRSRPTCNIHCSESVYPYIYVLSIIRNILISETKLTWNFLTDQLFVCNFTADSFPPMLYKYIFIRLIKYKANFADFIIFNTVARLFHNLQYSGG